MKTSDRTRAAIGAEAVHNTGGQREGERVEVGGGREGVGSNQFLQ